MKKSSIVNTNGMGFRIFVLSDFLLEVKHTFNEEGLFPCLPASVYIVITDCRVVELDVFEEHFVTWFFRKAKEIAHLESHKTGNFGITDNLKTNKSINKGSRGCATRFTYKFISHCHSEKWIFTFNFILCTSPAEDPIRFKEISAKYPFIIWNSPDWKVSRDGRQEVWSQRVPSVEDVKKSRTILGFSDVSMTKLSTMSQDFMEFDKPVINPVFGNEGNCLYNDGGFLNYQHNEYVVNR